MSAFTLSKILSSGVGVLGFPYFPDITPLPFTSPEGICFPVELLMCPSTRSQAALSCWWTGHSCYFPLNVSQTLSLTPSIIHWNLYLFMTNEIRTGRCDPGTWYKIASSSAEAINPCFLWNVTSCHPAHQTVSSLVSFGTKGKLRTIILYRVNKNLLP